MSKTVIIDKNVSKSVNSEGFAFFKSIQVWMELTRSFALFGKSVISALLDETYAD